MHGTILNVCVSTRKGTPKRSVDRVFLRRHHGLEGDAHAGIWHRQVSLLDEQNAAADFFFFTEVPKHHGPRRD